MPKKSTDTYKYMYIYFTTPKRNESKKKLFNRGVVFMYLFFSVGTRDPYFIALLFASTLPWQKQTIR